MCFTLIVRYGTVYSSMKNVVIDTNVFITALMSQRGASFRLLSLIGTGVFDISLSVPLVLEYEAVARRMLGDRIALTEEQLTDIIDYVCAVGQHYEIYYLWRPLSRDPADDMVIELAVRAGAWGIITFNAKDFRPVNRFGLTVVNPQAFLKEIGVIP